ncbi:MAG: MlaD family protein [Endozoicomonas sp. (ex Botrylloides leachii)]|nr:MlaD family protein [Endozoicomonas sp. (ex Botrylloides leachii)]
MNHNKEVAKTVVGKSRRISPVWLLPIIALLIVGWLGWRSIIEQGVEIHVQFHSGQGIQAGKTNVIHNGLIVGHVKRLVATEDMKAVDATIVMASEYKKYLVQDTQFWLVKPQITMAGVSGLETLVSGNFIAFKPSTKGKATEYFKALDTAPPIDDGGLSLTLRAKELSSLGIGSPVYFRRYKVGEVIGYSLAKNADYVDIRVYIESAFKSLVKKNTCFWNASGINISGNLTNIKIRTQSIVSIIHGGIAFYTPDSKTKEKPAENNDTFRLYENYTQAQAGIPITIKFPLGVTLVSANAPIFFHGFEVGRVESVNISDDLSSVIVKAVMRPETASSLVKGVQFWVEEPRIGLGGVSGLDTLIHGRYLNVDLSPLDQGNKKPTRLFNGYAKRPPASALVPGLHLTLRAPSLSGLREGSPVLFRNMPVGSVQQYTLVNQGVNIRILIKPEFAHLINRSTRFWNASGLKLQANLSGVKVNVPPITTLVSGGIAFITPKPGLPKINNGSSFMLFKNESSATENGTMITLQFETAEGLREGSLLKYRGLNIGHVAWLGINKKTQAVIAKVFIKHQYKWLAAVGSRFWLVKPKLGLANTSHLETVLTGPYIAVQPTAQKKVQPKKQFIAINHEPYNQRRSQGVTIELVSKSLGSLHRGNPVYYRNIPVGTVTGYALGNPADHVVIFINIESRYAGLISDQTKFWNVSGVRVNVGLFTGAKVKTNSLEALLAGGIAFATPDIPNKRVTNSKRFTLYPKVNERWLQWHPEIPLNMRQSANTAVH